MRKMPQARGGTCGEGCRHPRCEPCGEGQGLGTALPQAVPGPKELAPQCCSAFALGFFGPSFPESSGGAKDLCTPQNEEAAPHPPMVCFLSGGVEPSETRNDRCCSICCRSCWKIVWKALTADGELEFQLTPVADRSFQAGNISIISPSRKVLCKT